MTLRKRLARFTRFIAPVTYVLTVVCLALASLLWGGPQEFFATAAYVCIVISAILLLFSGRTA
jgi:hypothetical protein